MIRLLFVCMGNICRSPAAEGLMIDLVKRNGFESQITCDSAGTLGYHEGALPDARMRKHALSRGIELSSRARKFVKEDFENFDYILAMDNDNFSNILALDPQGKYKNKVFMMTDFCKGRPEKEVPDPYYGGATGFDHVLDILENATKGLLEKVKAKLPK